MLDFLWSEEAEKGAAELASDFSSKVEAMFGPGQQIPVEAVTQIPGSSNVRRKGNLDLVVDGDQFFRWENRAYSRRIELGRRDGKVCDKFYWEPSLYTAPRRILVSKYAVSSSTPTESSKPQAATNCNLGFLT